MKWRIYYGDGSTYSNDDGSYLDAPTLNVQIIAVEDSEATNGRALMHSRDVYWWTDNGWNGGDIFGFHQYLFTPSIHKYAVFGTSIDNKEFMKILAEANRRGIS